jgi:hypothetical protein
MKHFVPDPSVPPVAISSDDKADILKRHLQRCSEDRAMRRPELRAKHLQRNKLYSALERPLKRGSD